MIRKSILIIILGVLALIQPITGQTATAASGTQGPVSSYVLGDTLAYGLDLDGLAAKLQEKLGGPSRISYDGGRSITTRGVQIKQTAFESVEADKDFIASAGVIIIILGMNPQESSFADSQQQLIKKFKIIAPDARYYWVDIGATVSTHVDIWNARNEIIYENSTRLGYSVISRYRAIFGSAADPLNITPGLNFPGWGDEPGLTGPGNMHGYYPELTRAILTDVTNPTTETVGLNAVSGGKEKALKSYVLGDSIAYGLHLDGLAAKLQERLGGISRISYDGGRSITTAGNQIRQTALESVKADKDFIASAGVIVIVLGTNPQESSFADSQQLLIRRLKRIAPNARYYWVDIGATASSHAVIWNERNKIIYENSSRLGYSVISRYKAIFGSAADPLNITPGLNFPGWANEPGLNGPGNMHGYYPELTRAILTAVTNPTTGTVRPNIVAGGKEIPLKSYILGDSIAYGLHLDGLEGKLQERLGGASRISYDGGRSITTPGNQIKQTAFESVDADKDFIATAGVIVIILGMNPQESSFADSQQQLIKKLKGIAPNARYFWVDIGATVSTHVDIWNARNQIIYENSSHLGYSVISRYNAIFGSAADPLHIRPGLNFPGWESEPGLNGPGNIHGYYPELTRAIVSAVTSPASASAASATGSTLATAGSQTPLKSYILGDSIAYGLHLDGLAAKLQERLGGASRISYDGGRSITTPGNQIKQTAFESVDADKDFIASAGVIVIVLGTNMQESSFADSQQQLIRKLKGIAPAARYFWVDIGATVSTHVDIWNARNQIIYENSSPLGYSVISRYKAIFGSAADPLHITPGLNFPGWANEPGFNAPGNSHGYYPELTRAIVSAVTSPAVTSAASATESTKPDKSARAACNNASPLSTYVLGDSIAFGLHRDRLSLKLQAQFGGVARISYDTGRSIVTPGVQIKKTAFESVDLDKAFIANANFIIVSLGTNQREDSFADSQLQLIQKLKRIAPNAKYYWIDIGATISSQVAGWNARNKIIYDNARGLGYTVISRYKTIFGSMADPLNITPVQNFPGWFNEPGLGGPGNIHGFYSELTETILDVLSESAGCIAAK